MKAVITVIGKDNMGIIAKVSMECFEYGVNIIDISQSVLKEYFAMIMLVDISKIKEPFNDFVDHMAKLGETLGLEIRIMHEDLFNCMHRI